MSILSRRMFVATSSGALLAPAMPARTTRPAVQDIDAEGLRNDYPAQNPDVVRSVVLKSHADYDGVCTLVTEQPELAKATWDWGFGDWESALGAASHMGRRDIAEFLIANGARPDLFTFAMFGDVDVVRAICAGSPGIQRTPGPHGITLLQHAKFGGDDATDVVAYLEELGDADIGQPNLPLTEEEMAMYVGNYVPVDVPDTVFKVAQHQRRKGLTIQRDDRLFRFLMHAGNHTFSPGGAPNVKIMFEVNGGKVVGMVLRDGGLTLRMT